MLIISATITTDTSTARIYGYQVLLGLGAGAYAQAGYAVIQAIVEPAMMAYGIGFMMLGESSSCYESSWRLTHIQLSNVGLL